MEKEGNNRWLEKSVSVGSTWPVSLHLTRHFMAYGVRESEAEHVARKEELVNANSIFAKNLKGIFGWKKRA